MSKGGGLSRAVKGKSEPGLLGWRVLAPIVRPEPGFLVIILGAPAVGKSTVGIQYAYSLKKPSLIISLDTDLATQASRVRAMMENRPVLEVKAEIESDPERWSTFFSQDLPLVRWSDTPMLASDLDEMLDAEQEFLGEVPALVVVDVLGDIVEREDYESYLETVRALHRTARKQKTVVVALHHLKRGPASNGAVKFGLSEGLFGGERSAEIVLGMWEPSRGTVVVAVLKNRTGPADRNGDYSFGMRADLSRSRIGGDGLEGYSVGNLRLKA